MTITAEVHAEADFDPGDPKPFDVETPESLLKPKCKRTMDPKLDIYGIYRIKDDVAWKIIENDWEKFRIADENPNLESIELIKQEMDVSVDSVHFSLRIWGKKPFDFPICLNI